MLQRNEIPNTNLYIQIYGKATIQGYIQKIHEYSRFAVEQ